MKFARKLACSMIVLLAAAFSLGGYYLVRANFKDALASAVAQGEAQHALECYVVQSDVFSAMANGREMTDDILKKTFESLSAYGPPWYESVLYAKDGGVRGRQGGSSEREDAQPVDANVPDEKSYLLERDGDKVRMLLASPILLPAETLWLRSSFDITPVYEARQRQMLRLWQMESVTVILASALIFALCVRLTKPLQTLTAVSRSIVEGAYGARTHIVTGDEIEQVSRSFDAMAASVEEKIDALHLSVRQRDDFMGAFSHELKTPMTAIVGYADILRTMQCEPEQQRRAAGYIFSEARRVERLSQKFLQLLGLGDTALTLVPLPLRRVTQRVATAIQPFCTEKCGTNIDVFFADTGGTEVMADEDLLCDLLYNLIHNAIKAKPRDGMVRIEFTVAESTVTVCVRDNGCGIPSGQLSRITEPFYVVDQSRARADGGSGMGLALCEKIAHVHMPRAAQGASLAFSSEEGIGTEVCFVLQRGGEVECTNGNNIKNQF